jgi:hypothetical protein
MILIQCAVVFISLTLAYFILHFCLHRREFKSAQYMMIQHLKGLKEILERMKGK